MDRNECVPGAEHEVSNFPAEPVATGCQASDTKTIKASKALRIGTSRTHWLKRLLPIAVVLLTAGSTAAAYLQWFAPQPTVTADFTIALSPIANRIPHEGSATVYLTIERMKGYRMAVTPTVNCGSVDGPDPETQDPNIVITTSSRAPLDEFVITLHVKAKAAVGVRTCKASVDGADGKHHEVNFQVEVPSPPKTPPRRPRTGRPQKGPQKGPGPSRKPIPRPLDPRPVSGS